MSRAASLLERTENRLTITGSTTKVEAFKQDVCSGVSPASLSFLPRGVLFDKEATSVLTFQKLLPVQQRAALVEPEHLAAVWGSTTDALEPRMLEGRLRRKGRSSVVFEFVTAGAPPLPWLAAAAEAQPSLRLSFKWAQPESRTAFEAVYQDARLIHRTQVSFTSWVWEHKVAKDELFAQLKGLLRFPDGRVPRKQKLKAVDVEWRLHQAGAYTQAVVLLVYHGWGAAAAEAVAENAQSASSPLKLFHRVVLPEFAAWLYSSEGRVLK
jgi:hypothetical protein